MTLVLMITKINVLNRSYLDRIWRESHVEIASARGSKGVRRGQVWRKFPVEVEGEWWWRWWWGGDGGGLRNLMQGRSKSCGKLLVDLRSGSVSQKFLAQVKY
jgi:hypothetical protein